MSPARPEFRVQPASLDYQTRVDQNGYGFDQVKAIINTSMIPVLEIPGMVGHSQVPWVITERSGGFQFGIQTYIGVTPDAEFIGRLNRTLSEEVPPLIPVILDRIGRVQAAGYSELQATLNPQTPDATERTQRKYYALS